MKKQEIIDLYHCVFNNFQNRDGYIDVMKIAFMAAIKKMGNKMSQAELDKLFTHWMDEAKEEVEMKIETYD